MKKSRFFGSPLVQSLNKTKIHQLQTWYWQ